MTSPTASGAGPTGSDTSENDPTWPDAPGSAEDRAQKRRLRVEMRQLRRAVTDPRERSERIWATVRALEVVHPGAVVMVFTTIPGEPHVESFAQWCRGQGCTVLRPEDDPDPARVDVVVVPGLAFTSRGDRLGQGGGWYDRFLAGLRPGAVTIGVGFREQLVDRLPVEPHDVRLAHVVTA